MPGGAGGHDASSAADDPLGFGRGGAGGAGDLFSGGSAARGGGPALGMGRGRRYQVLWSPQLRGVVAVCSFDRRVQLYSVTGLARERAPAWLGRRGGVCFGFGGKLVSFGAPAPGKRRTGPDSSPNATRTVKIEQRAPDHALVERSRALEAAIDASDLRPYCQSRAEECDAAGDAHNSAIWSLLAVLPEADPRPFIVEQLGYSSQEVTDLVNKYADATPLEVSTEGDEGRQGAQEKGELEADDTANKASDGLLGGGGGGGSAAGGHGPSATDVFGTQSSGGSHARPNPWDTGAAAESLFSSGPSSLVGEEDDDEFGGDWPDAGSHTGGEAMAGENKDKKKEDNHDEGEGKDAGSSTRARGSAGAVDRP